jgi:SAM-dependent methyltransferase
MSSFSADGVFAGAIPQLYERFLVPLIFEPYALDIAARVAALNPLRVLEVGAGTGVATRQLAKALPAAASIVASDLNQPMLDHAASLGTARPVEWRCADAMALPFADGSFDAVVCQFGVMFFHDKAAAFAEAHRVLRPGGVFLFSVWDRIELNDFADVVTRAMAELFPSDPPQFLARTPHGHHDQAILCRDVERGRFENPAAIATLRARSRASSPTIPAIAYCQGTPLRTEIEARNPAGLARATEAAARRLAAQFGEGPIEGNLQAHVVSVVR